MKTFVEFKYLWLALLSGTALTLLTWIAVRWSVTDGQLDVFLLGDSEIANFRLAPGERIEDHLERAMPGARAYNLGRPGAFIGDYYLLLEKGRWAVEPEVVVAFFAPVKFHFRADLPAGSSPRPPLRLSPELAELRWLPFDAHGYRFWKTLSGADRAAAAVQKLALWNAGYYEVLNGIYEPYLLWPNRRRMMLAGGPEWERKTLARIKASARQWDREFMEVDEATFQRFAQVRDFLFLADRVRRDGKLFLAVLLPAGNPAMIERYFSPAARQRLEHTRRSVAGWLERQDLLLVDLSGPEIVREITPDMFDDLHHLKDGRAIAVIARRIAAAYAGARGPVRP